MDVVQALVPSMHVFVTRRASIAGNTECGDGIYGVVGVTDSYAFFSACSCFR